MTRPRQWNSTLYGNILALLYVEGKEAVGPSWQRMPKHPREARCETAGERKILL
jgi:hypothetical protein